LKPRKLDVNKEHKKTWKLDVNTKTTKTHKLIHRFYGVINLFLFIILYIVYLYKLYFYFKQ